MYPQMQTQSYIPWASRNLQAPRPCTTKTTIKILPPIEEKITESPTKEFDFEMKTKRRRRRRAEPEDITEDTVAVNNDGHCFCRVYDSDKKKNCSCGAYKGGAAEKGTLVCKCRKPVKTSKIMNYCEKCIACSIENQRYYDEFKAQKYRDKIYMKSELRKMAQEDKMKRIELKYKVKHYLKYLKKTETDFNKNTAIDFKAVQMKDKGIQHVSSGRERLFTTAVNLLKNLRTEEPPKRTICLVEPGPCFIKYALRNELFDTSTNPLHGSILQPLSTAATSIMQGLSCREPCLPKIGPFQHAADACSTVQKLACRPPPCCMKIFNDPCFTEGLLRSGLKPSY